MSTLLEYLSVADPSLDRTNVKTGSNSFNRDWEDLEGIEEWTDFIYDNLIAMLGDVLARPYQQHEFDPPAPVQRSACCIINEPTVTAVLLKWNHTIVDCALELASKASATMPAISWTLGNHTGLCGETVLPDWAGIYSNMPFPPSNRVPGDTKVSGKWNTDQQHDPLHSKRDEFHKPLRQVVHYAKLFNTRYAYVISDKELVCIRRTVSEYEGVPLAAGRTARISQPSATPSRRLDRLPQDPTTPSPRTDSSPPFRVVIPHAQSQRRDEQYLTPERRTRVRQDSVVSTRSALSNMSLDSPNLLLSSPSIIRSPPSAYTDGGNLDVNEGNVQIAVIPWGESRPNHLTVNLALFWLHILAGCDINLQPSYPPLGKNLAVTYGMHSCDSFLRPPLLIISSQDFALEYFLWK
ncbi:hypothetical protein RJZ56_007884 [Blastomyces dermatitidis]|uniref:Uncharacterized protein n=1 Tax=Blastomyces gilchristii (strain SLH14081) TaxID=559298 RepID=A0A179U8H5_BLAGS|nr:uncharacterized protein BDBG_00882 [Blastomyces gilchristii SLH14081]OAT04295.1 hypothetical protein BDBG_00882 [Blastomyces gilchristii SLH14081]